MRIVFRLTNKKHENILSTLKSLALSKKNDITI